MASVTTSANASSVPVSELCLDRSKPPEVRARILLDVLEGQEEPEARQALLANLIQAASSGGEAQVLQMMERYEQGLAEMSQGALRPATYLGPADPSLPSAPGPRVQVITPDGQERFPTLHERVKEAGLATGQTVYLDAKGAVVLGASAAVPQAGQEGTFLRLVDGSGLLETAFQNDRLVVQAAAPVREALARGGLRPGDRLLVCPRRLVAFAAVPRPAEFAHRFLERGQLPEVLAERDIGNPHWVLDYLLRRVRLFLFRPDLLERFEVRPRCAVLLTGPSGCGKTLTIRAFLHAFRGLLAQRTGRNDLGSRVVRVKAAELLSEWLGRSDKNIEELFDDLHAVAAEEVTTARNERLRLPVVLLLEEVEGLAHRRTEAGNVYDRVLTTLLQRLDDPTDDLARVPLLLVSTTNRPDLIDAAMLRRLGLHARFGRLDREGLAAVLDKKLRPQIPYAVAAGQSAEDAREEILARVVRWLFGPGGDVRPLIALTLHDGEEVLKRRRDFLTGGLVDQAVSAAIDRTLAEVEEGETDPRLRAETLIAALRHAIDSVAEQLTPCNVGEYVDVPEPGRVTAVRRLLI
jgi:ATP-dependent 26S proteasome regulatory subunit